MGRISSAFGKLVNKREGRITEVWNYNCGSEILAPAQCCKFNEKDTIVIGTKAGRVINLDLNGKEIWSVNVQENISDVEKMFLEEETANSINTFAVGDINNDRKNEII